MKRFATACVLLAATLPLTGCFGGGGSDESKSATESTNASASKCPLVERSRPVRLGRPPK